jgi:S1-C subfamily serine protease
MPQHTASFQSAWFAGFALLLGSLGGVASAQPDAVPPPKPVSGDDAPADGAAVRKSLVKIFTTSREPDLARPWKRQDSGESSGSGVVIDGNRVITNNHVVEYATRVLVQPDGSSDKFTAKVIAAAPGIDLAILELTEKDTTFFTDHPPLEISDDLPSVGQTVWAYGYPVGGDAVSITKGVISRIEHTEYNGITSGLRIQIDAAINPGNSGGPAVMNGKLVGLSFSGLNSADNVGYIIPVEEIRAFLEDIQDGSYQGRPQLFRGMQTVENSALRAKLGLTKDQTGLMVTRDDRDNPGDPLKEWDVVSAIGPHKIDNTGMVSVRENLRLSYRYYVPRLASNGTVPLTVIRDGKQMDVQMPVSPQPNRLFKPLNGAYPRYFITGPMCFMTITEDHVARFGGLFLARNSPVISRREDKPKFADEEIVVGPARLFSHAIMKGYEVAPLAVLKSVNGVKINNLKHLVEVIRDSKDQYLIFNWDDNACETIVFAREELLSVTDEILEGQEIRNQMSDDLKPLWNAKE